MKYLCVPDISIKSLNIEMSRNNKYISHALSVLSKYRRNDCSKECMPKSDVHYELSASEDNVLAQSGEGIDTDTTLCRLVDTITIVKVRYVFKFMYRRYRFITYI